ncbi:MAG: WD40 repeat domain-containing protein [Anaerolineae bacterium]|nr:WD40 repeat domain-containing protein [Anaerolineae bacterium]
MKYLNHLPMFAVVLLICLIPVAAAAQVNGIIAVAWSPDGRRIALSGTNGLLQIRDPNNQLIHDFPGLTTDIMSVDWSPDSTKIVSGGDDGKVIVWDAATGQQLADLPGFGEYIFQVAWSPDGTKIAATGNGFAPRTSLIVWNALNFQRLASRNAGDAFGISWKPDSSQIAVAKGPGYVSIYAPSLGPSIAAYQIDAGVLCVSWSPDGSKIALGESIPGTTVNKVEVRDASTGTLIATYTGQTEYITAVAFSPDSQHLASASADGTIKVWNLATGRQIATYTRPRTVTISIGWSPDGSKIAYASNTGTLQVAPLPGSSKSFIVVAWSADNTRVVYSDDVGTLKIQNVTTREVIGPAFAHDLGVMALAWRPQSDEFASVGGDNMVKIWNGMNLTLIRQFEGAVPGAAITSVDWNPTGDKLAIGTTVGGVTVFDVNGTPLFGKTDRMSDQIYAVRWISDNRLMKIGGESGLVVWDIDLNLIVTTIPVLQVVYAADINPSGDQVAISNMLFGDGSQSGSLAVWSLQTGQRLYSQIVPNRILLSVDWSPDGSHIATSSENGIDIWNAADGALIRSLEIGHRIRSVAWDSTGSRLAYGTNIGDLAVIPVPAHPSPG